MIRVVLDANQFVSAIIIPKSNPAKILDLVKEGKIKLVISLPILEEVKKVLLYPHIKKRHEHSPNRVDEFIEEWKSVSEVTQGKLNIEAIKNDPTDDKYLECAVEGEVDYIISGDHHLTDLKFYQRVSIVSPAIFLKIIEGSKDAFKGKIASLKS